MLKKITRTVNVRKVRVEYFNKDKKEIEYKEFWTDKTDKEIEDDYVMVLSIEVLEEKLCKLEIPREDIEKYIVNAMINNELD